MNDRTTRVALESGQSTESLVASHCKSANTTEIPYPLKLDRHSSHFTILKLLPEGQGRTLLDVGAAQGDLSALLTKKGYRVTALEGNAWVAELARNKCENVIVANLDREIPDLGGPYDVAVYGDVLEHLVDPLTALKHINHYVKPDGTVIVSLPNVAHLWVRLQLLLGRFDYMDRGILDRTHLRFFTLRSFLQFLRDGGLEVITLTATPVPLPLVVPQKYQGVVFSIIHSASAALARFWKTMFGYQFVAVCCRRLAS